MIVIGVDVHKHSLTAVAVDEVGRQLDCVGDGDGEELVAWSKRVGRRRLVGAGGLPARDARARSGRCSVQRQRLVRVPPRLTAPERRRGRARGKSDLIDALAVARAALQGAACSTRRGRRRRRLRELKLLVDHRDDLVDERRRAQQRLRWHLHELDPTLHVPLGALDRAVWLDRLGRQLARREQTTQVRIARELLGRCRSLTRSIGELDRELHAADRRRSRRDCSSCPAAAASPPPSCSARSAPSTASAPTPSSPATPASHPSTPAPANTNATASTAAATANSTAPSTASRSPKAASTHPHAPTSNANKPKARAAAKPSAASNDNSPAPSTPPSKTSPY